MSEVRLKVSSTQTKGIMGRVMAENAAKALFDEAHAKRSHYLQAVLDGLTIPEGARFTGTVDEETNELVFEVPDTASEVGEET